MKSKNSPHDSANEQQKSHGIFDFFSQAPKKLLDTFIADSSDFDRKEKQEVYLEIAKSFQDNFNKPLSTCIGTVYLLCKEEDPFFLKEELISEQVDELSELARSAVLSISVRYEPSGGNRSYKRQIEIFFIDKGQVSVTRFESSIDWDFLPPDVRENKLRNGKAVSTFELYSQEA